LQPISWQRLLKNGIAIGWKRSDHEQANDIEVGGPLAFCGLEAR
jgi:hypothetical protein